MKVKKLKSKREPGGLLFFCSISRIVLVQTQLLSGPTQVHPDWVRSHVMFTYANELFVPRDSAHLVRAYLDWLRRSTFKVVKFLRTK